MDQIESIHQGDRDAVLSVIKEQQSELNEYEKTRLTCPCGSNGPLREMFKCYYCGIHFCPSCAESHFQ